MLRTFRFSIATKSLDRMTPWAFLPTQSLGLRDTLRCALPNLFLALALFLLPFWVLDRNAANVLFGAHLFSKTLDYLLLPKLSV